MWDLEEEIESLLGLGKGSGVNRSYLCPYHDEHHPSMAVNLDSGLWICFGCGERGNYEKLARDLGAEIDPDYIVKKAIKDATSHPVTRHNFTPLANALHRDLRLQRDGGFFQDFCNERGISPRTATVFGIGYDVTRNSLAFPYPDNEDGRVTGIKYRDRQGRKSAESGSDFGLYLPSLAAGREVVYVGEGESDTCRLWTELQPTGYGVVGTSGASVSREAWARYAIQFLFARRVVLCYDADNAGDACADIAMQVLGIERCIRFRPTAGKDVSEHLAAGGTLPLLG